MAKAKTAVAMDKHRAERFSASARGPLIEWEVVASNGAIFIQLKRPDAAPLLVAMRPDDAYELREAIGHAYDRLLGI